MNPRPSRLRKLFPILFAGVFLLTAQPALAETQFYSDNSVRTDPLQRQKLAGNVAVSEFTGALTYAYPITLPQGRNGLTPSIAIAHNSQDNSLYNQVGYHWSITEYSISRFNKKGVEQIYERDDYIASTPFGSGELVSASEQGLYSEKNEVSFSRYEKLPDDSWLITDKQGNKYKFGNSAEARQFDPADPSRIYKWMLEEIRDPNDNFIRYTYQKIGNQIYPYKIIYTGHSDSDGIFEVRFILDGSSREDRQFSYASGFLVETNHLISDIEVYVDGEKRREYALEYLKIDPIVRATLASITETGYSENGQATTLPTTSFEYSPSIVRWQKVEEYAPPFDFYTCWHDTPCSETDKLVFWDVTGDGLVDLINGTGLHVNDGKGGWIGGSQGYNVPGGKFPTFTQKLTDFDGNALSDNFTVYNTPDHQLKSMLRLSAGPTIMDEIPIYLGLGYGSFADNGASVADLNADGLPDIIQSRSSYDGNENSYTTKKTCLNKDGTSCELTDLWQSPIPIVQDNLNYQHPRTVYVEDCNNDGLADISGYINDGKGGWKSMAGAHGCSFTTPDTETYRSVDVNGDGLIDRIRAELMTTYSSYIGYSEIHLNTGIQMTGDVGSFPVYLNVGANMHVPPGVGTRIIDINGDLLPDVYQSFRHIKNSTNSNPNTVVEAKNLWLNTGSRPYFLKTVNTSTGGEIKLEYKTSAQYMKPDGSQANPKLPIIVDTVSKMTVDDGMGNVSETNYFYEDGHYYFENSYDKNFAGFRVITKTDGLGYAAKSYYHQSQKSVNDSGNGEYQDHISKKGRAYRTEAYDNNGQLVSSAINRVEHKTLGTDHYYPYLSQTLSQTFDGGVTKAIAKHFTYDEIGNVIQVVDYGEVIASGQNGSFSDTGTDLLKTIITYISQSAFPYENKVQSQTSSLLSHSKTYYDGLALGQVQKGNVTAQEVWLNSPNSWLRSEIQYNQYGLPTATTNPRGFSTNTTYDSDNLYPQTITNAKGQYSNYIYDSNIGQATHVTDPNGSTTDTTYDGLGRPVRVEKDGQLFTTTTYNDHSNPRSIHATAYNDDGEKVDSYTYLDALDRSIESKQEAPNNKWVTTQVIYDERGNVEKQIQPYFSSSANFESLNAGKLGTNFTYDALGRVLTAINPLGTTSNSYSRWEVTTTDPNGNSKTLASDARGNLIRVDEKNGATYETHYTYDPLGRLTQVRDAENNTRTFAYDSLGRRTFQSKLASGAGWNYSYDQNSNLIQKTDPKGQVASFTYDELDRVMTENDLTFTYDQGAYAIGRLSKVQKPNYEHSFTYDLWGRVTNDHKQIDQQSFDFAYTYDRMGAVTSLTYPDSTVATNSFDSAHQLKELKVSDKVFADNFEYTPMGQVTQMTLGNGVILQNNYDENQLYRLTAKTAANGLQDYSYTYDPVGNLLNMVDANPGVTAKTVSYQYDDLYRLTQADYQNTANQTDVTQTYQYDSLGNMTFKSDVGQFDYNGQHPHAVTSTGSHIYDYDANGNMTARGSDQMTYDTRDRLTLSAGKASFTYGEGYDRLTKTDLQTSGVTYYPDKYFEVHPEKEVKYIYAGGLRIAKIEKELNYTPPNPDPDPEPEPDPQPDPDPNPDPQPDPTPSLPQIPQATEQGTGGTGGGSYGSQDQLKLMRLISDGKEEEAQELSNQIYLYTLNSLEKEKRETLIAGALPESAFENLRITYSHNSALIVWDSMPRDITAFRIFRSKGNHATVLEDAEVFLDEIHASRFTNRFVHQFDKSGSKYSYQVEALDKNGKSLLRSFKLHANQIYIYEGQQKIVDFRNFSRTDFSHVRIKSNKFVDGRETSIPQRLLLKPDADLTSGARLSVNFLTCKNKEDGSRICKKLDSQFVELYVLNRGKSVKKTVAFLKNQIARLSAAFVPSAYAEVNDETTYYLLTDHLGSVDVVIDEQGEVVERRDYLPYGSERANEAVPDSTETDHKFTGKELDDETGLYYYGARYYDPLIGRFVSVDPWEGDLKNPQSLNKYSYVVNNPVKFVDPTGMWGVAPGFGGQGHQAITASAIVGADVSTTWKISNYFSLTVGASLYADIFVKTEPGQSDSSFHSTTSSDITTAVEMKERMMGHAKRFFDSSDNLEYGRLLHMVEDSYSPSHVTRDKYGVIQAFLDYEEQNKIKHTMGENFKYADPVLLNGAVEATKALVEFRADSEATWDDVSSYLDKKVWQLAEDATVGTGGKWLEKKKNDE